jgi:hypothetical protein
MSSRVRRSLLAAVAVSIAVVVLPADETVATAPADADIVATAHAGPGSAHPFDSQAAVGRLNRNGHARATSTSSATCTGCDAEARTVQVVYANAAQVEADNVAAAWAASCTDCSATSVAVQVVLVGKRGAGMVLANQALAVNAVCDGCTSGAVAVQFVISGNNRRELTEQARSVLEELSHQLALDLETPFAGRGGARVTSDTPGSSSLTRLVATTAPETRSVERAAAALRHEFGRDAVTVDLEVKHGQ